MTARFRYLGSPWPRDRCVEYRGGGARKLQKETLAVSHRVRRPEHPNTSRPAWNLFQTLEDLGERDAARAILERDLLWLLRRDPATLGAVQREIRGWLAERQASSAGG
jgi:hypothetical protein